jgi:hypothetical protein
MVECEIKLMVEKHRQFVDSRLCQDHIMVELTLSPGAYDVRCNVATGEVTIPRAVVCNEKRSDAG